MPGKAQCVAHPNAPAKLMGYWANVRQMFVDVVGGVNARMHVAIHSSVVECECQCTV